MINTILLGVIGVLAVLTFQTSRAILQGVRRMARTEADLQADLDAIAKDLDAIKTGVTATVGTLTTTIQTQAKQISDLQAQLAAGTPVTQDQLTALATQADTLKSNADAILSSVTPPAPPTSVPGTPGV